MTVLRFGPVDRADEFQDLLSSVHSMLGGRDQLAMFPINFKLVLERRVWEHERRTANGRIIPPMSIYDLVHLHYPDGLGATFDIVENILRGYPDVLALWQEATKRKPGEGQARDAATGKMLPKLDNIQYREAQPAPTGTSAAAGLRKLQKAAAAGNDNARLALADVVAGRKKVGRACIEAGLRKDNSAEARRVFDRRSAVLIVEHVPHEKLAALIADLRAGGHTILAAEIESATTSIGEGHVD